MDMDPFTNSLTSQLKILDIGQENYSNVENTGSDLQDYSKTFNMTSITQQLNVISSEGLGTEPSVYHGAQDNLPNDVESLKKLLQLRIKYTRPQFGGYWEFEINDDVNYLKDCIKFVDNNTFNSAGNYQSEYNNSLKHLELSVESLDEKFNIKFYPYISYDFIKEELIETIGNSEFKYLVNLIAEDRKIGQNIQKHWIVYPNNATISIHEYIRLYDMMDKRLSDWILNKCLVDDKLKELLIESRFNNSFELINLIINSQNESLQINSLIDELDDENLNSSDAYLTNGILPYLTYIDHLENAIDLTFANFETENPYKTILLLTLILRGMKKYPAIYDKFKFKISDFLNEYPNFTLNNLIEYMKRQ